MWTTIVNLVKPQVVKYLIPVMGIGYLLLGAYCWYQHNNYENLYGLYCIEKLEKEKCEAEYALEKLKFKTIITQQNSAIEQYEINLKQFTDTVNSKEKELAEVRYQLQEQIHKELAVDSSSDKQLEIMNRIMYEFSNSQ